MMRYGWMFILILLLSACMPVAVQPTSGVVVSPTATAATNTATTVPSMTPTPTRLPPTVTPTPIFHLSSPLQGISLSELPEIVSNPFEMPHPRLDDGHHGVDFAFYSRGKFSSILGDPILSVLDGTVTAVLTDRPPYGNMIIIETPLKNIPAGLQTFLPVPTIAPTQISDGRLTCPESGSLPAWDTSKRSVYLLYAHMKDAPAFKIGDLVRSGQVIGLVGSTGQSSNPHLHLEVRVGPAHAQFVGLIAHKDGNATLQEMYNYCLWRISQYFQLSDPMRLLEYPTQP